MAILPYSLDSKILEIRDSATFIPVLCVDINPQNDIQRYYMRGYGYPCDGDPNVILTRLNCFCVSFRQWMVSGLTIITMKQIQNEEQLPTRGNEGNDERV